MKRNPFPWVWAFRYFAMIGLVLLVFSMRSELRRTQREVMQLYTNQNHMLEGMNKTVQGMTTQQDTISILFDQVLWLKTGFSQRGLDQKVTDDKSFMIMTELTKACANLIKRTDGQEERIKFMELLWWSSTQQEKAERPGLPAGGFKDTGL